MIVTEKVVDYKEISKKLQEEMKAAFLMLPNWLHFDEKKGEKKMGMDLAIWSARNHEVFKHDGWWESPDVNEEFYGRKAWHFVDNCTFIPKNYESGDFIELTMENLEEMIKVACEHRNYWENYDDVPKLCELRDKFKEWIWDDEEENPKKLYLEYNW